jgi:hypothetical protein
MKGHRPFSYQILNLKINLKDIVVQKVHFVKYSHRYLIGQI